ncbi:hypothetical protein NM688_g7303 [Phlebia brevispora]|uniref:Uncharacterized protein n=1 Tax=Phlebia brevispora TaxID=194682 RepID=A0ACC1S6V3_9APHY|nr:hypothetical protein NM688_g7303 [Phlebia brevispora]
MSSSTKPFSGPPPITVAMTQVRAFIAESGDSGWDRAWKENVTPWDGGDVQPPLRDLIVSGDISLPRSGRALVPGCGRGYDAIFIASSLGLDTLAVDISETAVVAANDLLKKSNLPNSVKVSFALQDFFAIAPSDDQKFDLVYDYTFFVAIPPSRRDEWGHQMTEIIKPGGYLVTLVFPLDLPQDNYPHVRTDSLERFFSLSGSAPAVRRIGQLRHVRVFWKECRGRLCTSSSSSSSSSTTLQTRFWGDHSMSRTCLRRFRLGRSPQLSTVAVRRNLHASICLQGAALDASSLDHGSDKEPARQRTQSLVDLVKERKLADLKNAVSQDEGDVGRAWACYLDAMNFIGPKDIPFELHQKSLRWCASSPGDNRAHLKRQLALGRKMPASHSYEGRLRAIVYNMRLAGYAPTIDDYHYILQHFAAVGHYVGAVHVLREIVHMRLPRTDISYGFCLLAMCRRLSLPCKRQARPVVVADISKRCIHLLNEMWADGIPVTTMNVDLTIRILKETLDVELFESILKTAYGIDLAYPDRPPIEFWTKERRSTFETTGVPLHLPEPLPFSTDTLNTTVDMLGRSGQISKLVQAFEVLTTPLPSPTSAAPPSTYEDDEDDDFGDSNPTVAPYRPPHALPNTTTYYYLLRWISTADNATLARHYVLDAIELERTTDRRLRGDCMRKSPEEIAASQFAVNRNMLLPVVALANRNKHMELLRWMLVKIRRVLRRKRASIKYFTDVRDEWLHPPEASTWPSGSSQLVDVQSAVPSEGPSSFAIPSDPQSDLTASPEPPAARAPGNVSPDVDGTVEIGTAPRVPSTMKPFDVKAHLHILRRDRSDLELLEQRIVDAIGRNSQRVKERLGRRVWRAQDIYLRTEYQRVKISRIMWRGIVNFRPHSPGTRSRNRTVRKETQSNVGPGTVAAFRGFFTSNTYQNQVKESSADADDAKSQ